MARDYNYEYRYERGLVPAPWGGFYPPTYWGGGPIYGLAGGGPAPFWPYFAEGRYAGDYYPAPRQSPERSPTYGRGGDRALQRWARRRGYDVDYTIRPRRGGGRDYRRSW